MGAPTRNRWQKRRDLPARVFVTILAVLLVSVIAGLSLGAYWATGKTMVPVDVIIGFTEHRLTFGGLYFAAMGAVAVALGLVFWGATAFLGKYSTRPSWVDVAAQHMASPKEAASLSRKAVEKKARKLGVKGAGK
ncbi:hypothetical protein ABH924_004620 [Arthrobacter sp. GAS37]|uniref:hypothetical protein n=1 Tax=Arthrobacter sp. GAS37 TaxID=3156261 RepID=UPI003832B6DA